MLILFFVKNIWEMSISREKKNATTIILLFQMLNEWSHNINDLMGLVMKTTHLINREEMVHKHMLGLSISDEKK